MRLLVNVIKVFSLNVFMFMLKDSLISLCCWIVEFLNVLVRFVIIVLWLIFCEVLL